jgi:hypothetical protein
MFLFVNNLEELFLLSGLIGLPLDASMRIAIHLESSETDQFRQVFAHGLPVMIPEFNEKDGNKNRGCQHRQRKNTRVCFPRKDNPQKDFFPILLLLMLLDFYNLPVYVQ